MANPARIYQIDSNSFGREASSVIGVGDEPEFWLGSSQITADNALQFSPVLNDHGDYAYVETLSNIKGSWFSTSIVLNGQTIQPANNRLNHKLAIDDSTIAWISTARSHELHIYDIASGTKSVSVLNFVPDQVALVNGVVFASGLDTSTGQSVTYSSSVLNPTLQSYASSESQLLINTNNSPQLLQVDGENGLASLFYAMHRLLGPQENEPFSVGNNFAGRQAWNVSYRLDALASLNQISDDPRLQLQFQNAVQAILSIANEDGLFPALRYSITTQTVSFSGHSGFIFANALRGIESLDANTATDLINKAVAAFDYFEQDWLGYYRSTPGTDYVEDGVIQPFNLQHCMGLLAAELFRVTGEERYRQRVEDLWSNFTSEFKQSNGLTVWNYYPQVYYDGWQTGTFNSTHMPTKPPTAPIVFSDLSHAMLDIHFLVSASKVLNRPMPFDLETLGNSLIDGPFAFDRYLGGTAPGSFDYLVNIPQSTALAAYFERYLPQWGIDMDSQATFRDYARMAMQSLGAASPVITPLSLTLTDLATGTTETSTLQSIQEVIDFWYAQTNKPTAPLSPHINGTDNSDTMQGSVGDDVLLALAGEDSIEGGHGNDWLQGERGDDLLWGEDGEDQLDGGDGNDSLFGGNGADTLRGQAGNDALNGGAGADQLTGGANNDWFIFAANQELAGDVVTDYRVVDTLYFGGSLASPTFSIIGQNVIVDGVQLTGAVTGDVHVVNQATLGLAATGQEAQVLTVIQQGHAALAGYGAYNIAHFDTDDTENWQTHTLFFNTEGDLSSFVEKQDDTATQTVVYDTFEADWAYERTDRTATGAISFKQFYRDDNSRVNTAYDVGTFGNLHYTIDEFNGPGVLQVRADVYDNGDILTTNYSAVGQALYSRAINTDGSRTQTNYDTASEPWSVLRTFKDGQNRVIREEQFLDDNTRVYFSYDQASADWYQVQTIYDTGGLVDWERTQYDDGRYRIVETDQLNQFQTWTYHVTEYSISGSVLSDYYLA